MKQIGLVLLGALLLALVGGLAWTGLTVPDLKSCVGFMSDSLKATGRADLKARAWRACRHARSTS